MRKKITILFLSIIIIILSLSSHAQVNRRDNKKSVPYRANYQRMSSGCSSDHSFEIREGTLWGWGSNDSGQAGDGTTINRRKPVQVGTDDNWISVSSGLTHTLGLKADGTLWAWGYNGYGELGDGTKTIRHTPVQIGNDSSWISISAGQHFSLALKSDGKLWAWGLNYYGQLGDGTDTNRLTPTLISSDSNWVSISTGLSQCHAIKSDGTLWAWGRNGSGNLGDSSYYNRYTPIQIGTENTWVNLIAGNETTFGLKSNGSLWGWGWNRNGCIGYGVVSETNQLIPARIGTDNKWINISFSPSSFHSLGIKANGTFWSWGQNYFGQLGKGDTSDRYSPSQIGNNRNWANIVTGGSHSIGLKSNRKQFCATGYNSYGQLGDGTTKDKNNLTCNSNCIAPLAPIDSTKTSALTICSGTKTTLYAVGLGSVSWYTDSVGGNYLDSGNYYNTPALTQTTIFYAQDSTCAVSTSRRGITVTVRNSYSTTLTQTACNSYTFKGIARTKSGIYYDSLTNVVGCDSIITLNLTIKPSSYNTLTKTACDKYTFKGNSLTNSGVYYDTLTNAVGCDSIITLNLTINNSTGITIYDTACGSYTFKGNTITSSGIYYDTLTNSVGCDSVVTLHLTIQPTNFSLAFTQNTQVFTTPPFDVLFLNTTPNKNNYAFTWLFGDGTYYNGTNPPKHAYQANGNYDITLIAKNNFTGCTDTLYKQGWILCSGGVTCTHTAQIIQTNIAKKCLGDSIYLSCVNDTAYTYQWLYNGIKIQGATDSFIYAKTAGQYSVIVTDSFCPLTSTAVAIGFYPLAAKPAISHKGNLVFCTGDSVELFVNNIYNTYSWNTGSQSYHTYVSNSGTYFVSVNDSNSCQAQSDTFSLNASFISPPPICLVSVDSATNKNIVIWEKAQAGSIDSFVILKETNQANVYNIIGKLPYTAFSAFVDTASNPDVQANRYKLQAVDTCGIITLPSDYHKTIHLTINKGQGTNWNLIWSHYEGIQFSSYNIYRGSSSTTMALLTAIASNLNSYTDINPPSGNLFYQIEVVNPQGCTPSQKTNSYSSSKSNIADVSNIGFANINNTKYSIFPNPTNNQFTIQSNRKLLNATIKLYNITGQIIIQKTNLSGDNFVVDLSDYAKGIYILEIGGGEAVERVKVVKE